MKAVLIFFSGLLLMQTAVAGGDPANGKKPVSYTHLDVYKRQG